jgi:hypothetical protein
MLYCRSGDVYLIIKTSPTVSADLVSTGGSGVKSYIDLDDRPDGVIDTTVIPATTSWVPLPLLITQT